MYPSVHPSVHPSIHPPIHHLRTAVGGKKHPNNPKTGQKRVRLHFWEQSFVDAVAAKGRGTREGGEAVDSTEGHRENADSLRKRWETLPEGSRSFSQTKANKPHRGTDPAPSQDVVQASPIPSRRKDRIQARPSQVMSTFPA